MPDIPPQTALIAFLKAKDAAYYGKVCELREAVRGWLNYIPQTFPNYTRHTLEHSDEIVSQISRLLFTDGDPDKPVVNLSPAEAYILIAAAYLHDAGMVASDREKQEILQADAWKTWVTDGPGAKRWREVQALRDGNAPAEESVRHFLADVQTRFLIAEFVRRTHHTRAGDIATQHEASFGAFAFGDPTMRRTIADICVAHGLRPYELDDRERYPDRRDIRDQPTNVRFIAILLRLGDLLDMSYDRACPLLLNAACPIPTDSLAHWTQYQRITHHLTAPDRIEVAAECQTQDEHRVLQDWCQWIVDEVQEARSLMARAERHREWELPQATLDGPDPTIVIRPAEGATYVPSKWTFELDHEAVFQRLIYDVYDRPETFIRELLQNGLDANRCQMYAGLVAHGIEPPEYPTQADEDLRRRYPVHVSLRAQDIQNPLSGEAETRQILTVEDCGIGMDNEIIQRYFLQVGRSYYTTDEFRRSFRFVPTSRFGLGFLSVFAVSDHVTVETYKPSSPKRDGPIRLILSGPRNYLLTDQGQRQSSGTRVDVLLREPMESGALTNLVSAWCRKVEFPIVVNDLGTERVVEAEAPEDFTYQMPDVTEDGADFAVRAFAVNRPGVEGELYVFAHIQKGAEDWAKWDWAQRTYPGLHPRAGRPSFPPSITCVNGISPSHDIYDLREDSTAERLDIRSRFPGLPMGRRVNQQQVDSVLRPLIDPRWEEILTDHLNTSPYANEPDAWKYKQRLVDYFHLRDYWTHCPGTIRLYEDGHPTLLALEDVLSTPLISVTVERCRLELIDYEDGRHIDRTQPAWDRRAMFLTDDDLDSISQAHRREIFGARSPINIRWLPSDHLAIDWSHESCPLIDYPDLIFGPISVVELPASDVIGFPIHPSGEDSPRRLLNESHPFVRWLLRLQQAAEEGTHGFSTEQFRQLLRHLDRPLSVKGHLLDELNAYFGRWKDLPDVTSDLYPPITNFVPEMFQPR